MPSPGGHSTKPLRDSRVRYAPCMARSSEALASGGGGDDDDAPAASSSSAPLFRVNDTLSIFSRTEQKEVLGRLMAADDAKLVLKLVDGTTCQFSLADVASGLLLVADATPTDKAEHD